MLFSRKPALAPQTHPSTLPQMPEQIRLARPARKIDWKRIFFIGLGLVLFITASYILSYSDAVDPKGQTYTLTREGRGALGIFLLAAFWWVFEVVPIGITAVAIGVLQALFLIRSPKAAFTDFMDPSVWSSSARSSSGWLLPAPDSPNEWLTGC